MWECIGLECDCRILVERVLCNDSEAATTLIDRFEPLIAGRVKRVLEPSRQHDWQDVQQRIWSRVIRGLGSWREKQPFCHWLQKIISNEIVTFLRVGFPREQPFPRSADVEDRRQSCVEEVIAIRAAFDELPIKYQGMIRLLLEGRTITEAAHILDVDRTTIYHWFAEIMPRLASLLDP